MASDSTYNNKLSNDTDAAATDEDVCRSAAVRWFTNLLTVRRYEESTRSNRHLVVTSCSLMKGKAKTCRRQYQLHSLPAKYNRTVDPIPPAPTTRTELLDKTTCPSRPIEGTIIWREYLTHRFGIHKLVMEQILQNNWKNCCSGFKSYLGIKLEAAVAGSGWHSSSSLLPIPLFFMVWRKGTSDSSVNVTYLRGTNRRHLHLSSQQLRVACHVDM